MKTIVIRITPKQSKKINTLIKKLFCNYVDDNCLLLDDDQEHACVQCISRYGIYFKNTALPASRELSAKTMYPAGKKQCQICKTYFVPKGNNQRYYPDWAVIQKRRKAAQHQRKKQSTHSQSGFKTES